MDTELPTTTDLQPTRDGILVVTYQQVLSSEQHNKICALLRQRFPDKRWLVLDGGATVVDTAAASRTEAKVDLVSAMLRRLLESLAEEEGDDADAAQSLDGGPSFAARDQSLSL